MEVIIKTLPAGIDFAVSDKLWVNGNLPAEKRAAIRGDIGEIEGGSIYQGIGAAR